MLPRLRPQRFHDLVVAISLIRPGPIQGNTVHPYLRRRQGLEPVSYAHPLLEAALRDTLGVILFQEQVLLVARDLAGFTPGQGEQLRRALGRKQAEEEIARFQSGFLEGARQKGVPKEVTEAVFEQLRAFGNYAFARSHAAAFAVIVYQSAWLKRYHFADYMVALLNNQPMGFWTPAVLVGEARRQGVAGAAGGRAADSGRAFDRWGLPRRQLLWELGMMGGEGLDLLLGRPAGVPRPLPGRGNAG
jgi:error-prone DNA polymerase